MRIFPPVISVGDKEGFSQEKDIFQRSAFGAGLTNLVAVSEDPLVIVLDSPWGTGKTTFIKMWASHLRQRGFPVVYFDAFENDHIDDAFLAIAGEVLGLSNSLKKTKTAQHRAFLKKASRAGGLLLRAGARIGVKAATLGAIDASDFDALKSVAADVAKETSTKADEYFEALLKLQSQERETLASVRQSLSELAKSFSSQESQGKSNEQSYPLIFIVDELDRCRPTFALELLEKIKHIFSIQHVHFVLVAHLHQLENSVRFNYGGEIDARTYLQKFYNLAVQFPEPGKHRHERDIPKYINYLGSKLSLKPDELRLIQDVAEARRLSLRAIERIAAYVALAKAFTPENYFWLDPIIIGLCVIKILDPEMYRRARSGSLTIGEVKEILAVESWPDDGASTEWVIQWWIYCLAKKEEEYPELD
jgi:hypothetical protein